MSRCISNTDGLIGLSLSQIGLFIATGILLTVVLTFVFSNDWQRNDELQSLASSFSNLLVDVDNTFFENTTLFQFPEKEYPYTVVLSTEYIVISAKGSWGTELFVTQKFLFTPWPRYAFQNWTTGEDLHMYLNTTCSHQGTENDSISFLNFTSLCNEFNTTIHYSALHPFELSPHMVVSVEKVTIFYEGEHKHDFLLVYQKR